MTNRLPSAWLHALLAAFLWLCSAVPAHAGVTITFWSQELGQSFPHAFFTLKGTPDAGGAPVDASFGFTAKTITPAILMGSVGGMIDRPTPGYIARSNAHFSTVLTDAQYTAVLALIDEWGEKGDSHYNLNRRNCVHFVAEAMRRSGLRVEEAPKLMKKPRSFSQSIAEMNAGVVRVYELPADEYLAAVEKERLTLPAPAAVAPGVLPPALTPPVFPPAAPVPAPAATSAPAPATAD